MKIIVTTLDGNVYPLEVSDDLEILNLKALCEQETNVPMNEMSLTFNGRPLNDDTRSLASFQIKDNDMIMVQRMKPNNNATTTGAGTNLPFNIDFSSIPIPQARPNSATVPLSSNAAAANNFRNMLMSDSRQFEMIQQRYPDLAGAIQRGDTSRMMQMLGDLTGRGQATSRQNVLDLMSREEQERIAEEIRLQNVQQNMEHAIEHMPEAFGHIVMLYVNCRVNGFPVKAFVDSGAQMTIMSAACAERCGIMRLVDKRWAGIAKGVGTQKIIGRVHLAQIQIENSFLTTAFSILEDQPMDMLLGLDILRRHQCIIDLQRNVLIIQSAGTETPFLPEAELPNHARLSGDAGDADEDMLEETIRVSAEAAANQPGTSQKSNYPEETVSRLVKLGYSRKDVLAALDDSKGDVNMAQVKLLAKSLEVPSRK